MFNISFGEVVVVGIVALGVLGPKQLPMVARLFAKYLQRTKKVYQSIKTEIIQEIKRDD